METINIKTKEEQQARAIEISKKLLESKRKTQEEMREAFQNDPKVKEAVELLRKRNAERGTPIVEYKRL
jgi:hypothetical protein